MAFDPEVADALGGQAELTWVSVESLIAMADSAPDAVSTVSYQTIALQATNQEQANQELISKVRATGTPNRVRSWSGIALPGPDGRFGAFASPFFRHDASADSQDLRFAFLLSEIHMRLGALWLNHLWRAAELAQGARDGLERWTILVAAACARSLLEGSAYLAIELPEVFRLWDSVKSEGHPRADAVNTFLSELLKRTMTAHYSTKLLQDKKRKGEEKSFLESRSAQTYIEKLGRRDKDSHADAIYAFLCDAIHPSFGSAMTYCTLFETDVLQSHRVERYYRRPLPHIYSADNTFPPYIAEAVAEAIILAARLLNRDLPALRWLVDDVYLTAELQPPPDELIFPWTINKPERNSLCPCGSGRKFKRCVHRWGLRGTHPAGNSSD